MAESKLRQEIDLAVEALGRSGIVCYPTETVYGLAVDATDAAAIAALFELKGREAGKGVSVLVANIHKASDLIAGALPDDAFRLSERFWPGPLTIVLPAAASVSPDLLGPSGGVGLRCTSDPVAAELVLAAGRPLTSTSANPAGSPPALSVDEARSYFGDSVDAYLDGGLRGGSDVSTVVEFADGRTYLRRAGAVPVDSLSAIVNLEE